jgi:hypothetical protein
MADFMGFKKKDEEDVPLEQPKSMGNTPVDLGADVTGPVKMAYDKYQKGRMAVVEPLVNKMVEATDLTPGSMPEARAQNIEDTKGKVMPFADLVVPEITDFLPAAKMAKFGHMLGMGAIAAKDVLKGFKGVEEGAQLAQATKTLGKADEAVNVVREANRYFPEAKEIVSGAGKLDPRTLEAAKTIPQGKAFNTRAELEAYWKQLAEIKRQDMLNKSKKVK